MNYYSLNVRRLLCPLPVIRTQNKIAELVNGDQLEIIGTDPGMLQDIPTWCRIHKHHLLSTETVNGEYKIVIEVIKAKKI
ncbi:MAG: hypothetical protein RL637_1864 [Pseudomonadota bacterium]|jgi:TusA-related sulfurtransferase